MSPRAFSVITKACGTRVNKAADGKTVTGTHGDPKGFHNDG